jgi:hypothetical protein
MKEVDEQVLFQVRLRTSEKVYYQIKEYVDYQVQGDVHAKVHWVVKEKVEDNIKLQSKNDFRTFRKFF